MNEMEILKSEELRDILTQVVQNKLTAVISHLIRGKWHTTNVSLRALTGHTLHVESLPDETSPLVNMEINQPVGVSIHENFNRYIFETVVTGFETSVSQAQGRRIMLDLPERMDRMQRRAYSRVPVPKLLNIRVLFWHRGYTNESRQVPLENYWQGKLLNISAGGVQIAVDIEQRPNFKLGQLVGLQFTPMSYQKPIHVEGQVRHIAQGAEGQRFCVGVEFVGLEASSQGRRKLRRIINTVNDYEKKNRRRHTKAHAVAVNGPEKAETVSPFGAPEAE